MFRLCYTEPSKIKGTIKIKSNTLRMGPIKDINGNKWDIWGYGFDKMGWWAIACPMGDLHPYYYDTSGQSFGFVSQKWYPYKVEEVNEDTPR